MQAIVFVGIQASGKSTFFQQCFFHTHVRISLDLLKTRHRERLFFNLCLKTQQPLVIDNTNPTQLERTKYIVPAKSAGYEINAYFFDTNIQSAILRNEKRMDKNPIPKKGVFATYKKLEPPDYEEGFDKIYKVILDEQFNYKTFLIPNCKAALQS